MTIINNFTDGLSQDSKVNWTVERYKGSANYYLCMA